MSAEQGPDEVGLSVVVPCFNEAENIHHVHAEILAELGHLDLELIFVDDGSTDGSLAAIRSLAEADPRVHYLSLTRNFGFEAAFSAGYSYARRPWILHLDADQQFPAAEARRLIETAGAGYDAVFGIRSDRKDSWRRRFGSAAFYFVATRLLGIELPRGATAFRLVRTSLARTIVGLRLGTPYFLATVPRITSRYTTVAVAHRPRLRGTSKMNFRRLGAHATGLFFSFGQRLTALASGVALVASALAVVGAVTLPPGLHGPAALLMLAVTLAILAFTVRYLVAIAASQARPRLFYIREASMPIDDEDQLDAHRPGVPTTS